MASTRWCVERRPKSKLVDEATCQAIAGSTDRDNWREMIWLTNVDAMSTEAKRGLFGSEPTLDNRLFELNGLLSHALFL